MHSWLTALRSEFIQLRWRLCLGAWAAALAVAVIFVIAYRDTGASNIQIAAREVAFLSQGETPEVCEFVDTGTGTPCAVQLRADLADANRSLAGRLEGYSLARAMENPLSSVGTMAGFAASAPGLLAVAILASTHVAGEWSRGTAGERLARNPRFALFVITKVSSIWGRSIGALGMLILPWAVAVWLVSKWFLVRPTPADSINPVAYSVEMTLGAAVVLLFFSAVISAIAVLIRSPTITFGTIPVCVLILNFMPTAWSPAAWVAGAMGFEETRLWGDHAWNSAFSTTPGRVGGLVALVAITVASILIAIFQLRWRTKDQ